MALSSAGLAQTLATGDSRSVTEPTMPAVCTKLLSQMAIVAGAPASETAFDTTRIQTALTACPSGQAVELASSGTNFAYLIQPINIPSGVGLIVDGGVTVFASRNPADYQTSSTELCGTFGASGNGCNNLISIGTNNSSSTGSGIYGYGVIDGRGGSTMLTSAGVDTGISWWTNADSAGTAGKSQDNFVIVKPSKANNLVLYKITLRNSPMFHVGWSGTGLTVWGVKISAPFTAHNTDGIDPTGTNVTITNSSISDGDDDVAVGASSASANVTVSNVNTYSGHGISVGSYTSGGLTNFLVQNVNMAGTAADGNATALRLKSALDRGGILNTITYQNVCIRDTRYPLQLNPFYNSNTGTLYPWYQNVVYQNVHVLAPTSTKYPYLVELQGYDVNHITSATFNNVVFDQLVATNVTPAPQNISIALAGNVYPSFLQTLTGSGVSYTGSATAVAGAGVSSCSGVFPYIVGELYASTASATSLKSASTSTTGSVTLNAMVEPAMSQTSFSGTAGIWVGAAAPANPVSFYEGSALVGTGTLSANGTLASLTLSNLTKGTHTYTAQYPADTNYATLAFGSVVVTVTGPTIASTTTLTAPVSATYGAATTLSATVAGTGGTPTGSVTFYDGTASLGVGTLASGTASIPATIFAGGSHSLTAVYGGDSTFLGSTSVAAVLAVSTYTPSTSVSASPATVTVNGSSSLTATVTGAVGASTPTGSVAFTDGTTTLGSSTVNTSGVATLSVALPNVGSRTIKACYVGDTNYASACGTVAVTVSPIATTVAVMVAPVTSYPGGAVTLTATVSPAAAGTTVMFSNGSTTLGTGITNAAGVATYGLTAGTVGSYALSASAAAQGNYAASTSTTAALSVVNPFALTATPNPIAITHGSSGTVTVGLSSAGGYGGAISVSCTTAVSYVTCSPSATSATVTSGGSGSVAETISVAATTSMLRIGSSSDIAFAMLAPFGILLLRRRKGLVQALVILLVGLATFGVMGCGGASSTSTPAKSAPAGSQIVTITATAAGISQTVSVTVTIN